jgi:hypothetical protein
MTREEWIDRYVEAMLAGGSKYSELHLRSRAEQDCDTTEAMGGTDPDDWEDPETIAGEHLDLDLK